MTLSSSDGWPLSGPEAERQPRAADVDAEDEDEQQQRDAGRGPRVLVATQPAIRADDDRERGRDGQPTGAARRAGPGRAQLARRRNRLPDEVLRQPLHQEQARSRRASPTAGNRTWSDPPPGERRTRGAPRTARPGRSRWPARQRHPQRRSIRSGRPRGRPARSHPGRRSRRRARPRRAGGGGAPASAARPDGTEYAWQSRCWARRVPMRSCGAPAPAAYGPGRSAARRRTRAGRPHRSRCPLR